MPGITNFRRLTANQAVAASVVLVDLTQSVFPIAALQTVIFLMKFSFTTGAAGGFRFRVATPVGFTLYGVSFNSSTFDPAFGVGNSFGQHLTAQTDFTNLDAGVNSGKQLEVYGSITNGAAAGNVSLQFAQNNADATPITMLAGGWLQWTVI